MMPDLSDPDGVWQDVLCRQAAQAESEYFCGAPHGMEVLHGRPIEIG
jgi:hypothetical protein